MTSTTAATFTTVAALAAALLSIHPLANAAASPEPIEATESGTSTDTAVDAADATDETPDVAEAPDAEAPPAPPEPVAPSSSEIPDVAPEAVAGQPLQFDLGNTTLLPTVMGLQFCDPVHNEAAEQPQGGRSWSYYDGTNGFDNMSADLTVTAWADSVAAWTQVRGNSGLCALFEDAAIAEWPGQNPSTHLLITEGGSSAALIRADEHIISVTVHGWGTYPIEQTRSAAMQTALEVAQGL